jgi:hypothetical protein
MRRISVGLTLCLVLASLTGEAQQLGKVYRIGYLSIAPGHNPIDEFFDGELRQRGYVEGQNLTVERRYTAGPSTWTRS